MDFRSRRLGLPVGFFLSPAAMLLQYLPFVMLLLSHGFFLASYGSLWSTACTRIGACTLTVYRKVTAMPHAAITADFNQPLDVHVYFAAQVSLDFLLAVDYFAQTVDLFFGQVFHPYIRVNAGSLQDLSARCEADPVNVRQRNLHALIPWNVNAGDSSHVSLQ